MPFRIALSGLNAASADLKVTGNNIANANTNGFKSSRAEFADVFAVSFGGVSDTAVGGGVRLARVAQQFSQGNIEFTSNNLDLALNGEGFFVLDDNGSRLYTRAGSFSVDRDGFVVNSAGSQLQAFAPLDVTGTSFNTGSLGPLKLSLTEGAPNQTSMVDSAINLDADSAAMVAVPINPAQPSSFHYSTSFTTYDSLGGAHTSTLYFQKTGANDWKGRLYLDNSATPVTSNGGADTDFTLTFNTDGTLNTTSSGSDQITFDAFPAAGTFPNGATPMNLDMAFTSMTQYGSEFSVNNLTQDGFTTGRLTGIDIADTGVVSARYTNGQSQALGKLALASFPNPGGLRQLGDNNWAESFAAGDVLIGEAGTASYGLVQSGALEASNVDIAEQLISLITAQRNFQANAQVITTADTITQTIINIR